MKSALVLSVMTALLWGSGIAFSQEAPTTGTISGRVVNGTAGAAVPAGVTVELMGTSLRPVATASSADDGTFEFDSVPRDEATSYLVVAEYAGVAYESGPLQFEDGQTDIAAEVSVYETIDQKDNIRIEFEHIIAEPDSASGHLVISETVRVVNSGDRTFIGREAKHEGMASGAVRFTLPEGAHSLDLEDGLTGDDVSVDPSGFFDTRPLPPGTREVRFAYGLEQDGSSVLFRRILDYPTETMLVLVRSDVPPESPLFPAWDSRALELTNGGTATYFQSEATGLTPATPVEISVRGLPPPPPPVSDAGARSLSLIIGAAGLVAALSLVLLGVWQRDWAVAAASRTRRGAE